MQPDTTPTRDMLDAVRSLYGWGLLTGVMYRRPRTDEFLWKIEKYLISRLERVGQAAPRDFINDDLALPPLEPDPTDQYDYIEELTRPDLGGSD